MDLTIREIAEKLEVSKNTVKYHMRKLDEELTEKDLTYKNGGMIYVRPEGIAMVQESVQQVRADEPEVIDEDEDEEEEPVSKQEEPAKTTPTDGEKAHIKDLQRQLEVLVKDKALKDEQLKAKDVQISELHRLLDQQQRLNLLAEAKIRQLEGRSEGTLQELLEEGVDENETKDKPADKAAGAKAENSAAAKKEEPAAQKTTSTPQKKWWQFWK